VQSLTREAQRLKIELAEERDKGVSLRARIDEEAVGLGWVIECVRVSLPSICILFSLSVTLPLVLLLISLYLSLSLQRREEERQKKLNGPFSHAYDPTSLPSVRSQQVALGTLPAIRKQYERLTPYGYQDGYRRLQET
jgi:hypothetical protein